MVPLHPEFKNLRCDRGEEECPQTENRPEEWGGIAEKVGLHQCDGLHNENGGRYQGQCGPLQNPEAILAEMTGRPTVKRSMQSPQFLDRSVVWNKRIESSVSSLFGRQPLGHQKSPESLEIELEFSEDSELVGDRNHEFQLDLPERREENPHCPSAHAGASPGLWRNCIRRDTISPSRFVPPLRCRWPTLVRE